MCSISGFISQKPSARTVQELKRIIVAAEERGRDSFGVAWSGGRVVYPGKPSRHIHELKIPTDKTVVINNNRAEPTTEYVSEKHNQDIQPFVYKGVAVSHNGTIANDRELIEQYLLKPDTEIDSGVIGPLVHNLGFMSAIEELQGSYALAVAEDNQLWLACNYKPLFIKRWGEETLFFSSLEAYLRTDWWDDIVQLPPYSATFFSPQDLANFKQFNLRQVKPEREVVVICSGGLDSVTAATHYVRQGYKVTLLHFLYGCRAEEKEILAVKAVGKELGTEVRFMDLTSTLKQEIGGSRLTNTGQELMTERGGERSAELAYEWVPARNLIFYALALALAESKGYDILALGNNLEEAGAYPDNEMIFTEKFSELIPYAVNLNCQVRVEQPLGNLMKHEIVKLGLDLGAPLDLTWSCYENGGRHCGTCGPCYMRRKAFHMNNAPEVVDYEQ